MSRRVKGEGSIYQRQSDGRWFYAVDLGWHGPAGAKKRDRRTVSASTLKALRPKIKALDEQVRAQLDGDGSMPVEKWLNYWLTEIAPETAKSARTRDTYKGYIDNWIVPHLGSKRLDRLRPADVRALYKEMGKAGRAAGTKVQVHAILNRALHVAENDRIIVRSPMHSVTAPGGDRGSHGKLTTAEARKVMRVLANRPDRARWYAALLLGLRQGEALGLAWQDLDLDRNIIQVRHSLGRVKGKGLELAKVKSQKSRRSLPLLAEFRAALDDVPRDTDPAKRTFTTHPEILKDFDHLPVNADLVWGPMNNKTDYNTWQAILAAAGVEQRPLAAARASTASILSDLGVPSKIIQEILGHAQLTTTENHYIHGDEAIHTTALEGLSRALTRGAT